jgi:hypothetical protein
MLWILPLPLVRSWLAFSGLANEQVLVHLYEVDYLSVKVSPPLQK